MGWFGHIIHDIADIQVLKGAVAIRSLWISWW